MKRGIIILILIVLLSSLMSAEIIFDSQPAGVYNLGDDVNVPITISSLSDVSGALKINLICNGTAVNLLTWNGLNLKTGYPKDIPYSFGLVRSTIGGSSGTCNIQVIFGSDNTDVQVSNSFKISNLLTISGTLDKTEFDAGETISINGKVTKETGENSNGFIETDLITNDANQNITQTGTITNGNFNMNVSLPSDIKAGSYILNIKAYEQDSDESLTNTGNTEYNISVRQVPTNLELIFDNKEIMPGTSLGIKAILHDQTGDPINSTVALTIKDSSDKIIDQKEINTGDMIEYPIKSDESPAQWNVLAESNQLTTEDSFMIESNPSVDIEIINKTISITNNGNVPYNKTLLIKVGDTPLNLDVSLNVGESKKYIVTAPDGEYQVDVVTSGNNEVSKEMSLTGNSIAIKETSGISFEGAFWVLLILVLGFVTYIFFKKVYKKPFSGRMPSFSMKESKPVYIDKDSTIKSNGKAELSLSIKGEKQDASVVCLKIKNLRNVKSSKGSASDSIKKIVDMAEDNKAAVYENQDYIFFIIAPIKTKTFRNEKTALELAKNIQSILTEHNRMFNQRIEFGISMTYGPIIAKLERDGSFKFMSLGSLITIAKRVASLANEEVLLDIKMNDLLRLNVRTEKSVRDGTSVFSITQIKQENEEARKFINRFMERQKKDKTF
jgi:hypothetical protein